MDVDSSHSESIARSAGPISPTQSLSGRRVGPYLLQSELGRGGMGSVWLARRDDGQYEARVAIKLLATAWLGREGEMRFRHEGMLLARLDHPNIGRLLDAGVTERGEPYLVLEYIDGQRVDDYCRTAALGITARIALLLELLSAVAHAHRNLLLLAKARAGSAARAEQRAWLEPAVSCLKSGLRFDHPLTHEASVLLAKVR